MTGIRLSGMRENQELVARAPVKNAPGMSLLLVEECHTGEGRNRFSFATVVYDGSKVFSRVVVGDTPPTVLDVAYAAYFKRLDDLSK